MTPPQHTQPGPQDDPAALEAAAELELLDRIESGDRDAMAELLTLYQPRLFGVCYRMVPDTERAADLTQDAFVKVLRGLDTFDRRSKLSTWMIRVTMNVCLSWLRAEKHRRHASLDVPADGRSGTGRASGTGSGTGSGSGPTRAARLMDAREPVAGSGVERSETQRMISAGLASIPPDHRAILILRDVQGLEYQQIAEVLELAPGTVKSRIFRARAALRAALEELDPSLADDGDSET